MKKYIFNTAIACISLVLLTLTSCEAIEISNDYASFKESDTEYKIFLELNSGSLNRLEDKDLNYIWSKYNQNEYKDTLEMNEDLKNVKNVVQNTGECSSKKDFFIKCTIKDRQGKLKVTYICPELYY